MYDYLLEKRLNDEAPELHIVVKNNISILQLVLESFFTWFPDFTDHSILHSMDVLDFCNAILDDQVNSLSIAECYTLIMGCYLHDIGMGVNKDDFELFSKELGLEEYFKKIPDPDKATIVRKYHNEFSGLIIRKYANMFEIISDDILFALIQVCRGHRKTDLLDEKEYPVIDTQYGTIRTAFLSAVLRLADEIDVGDERNPELIYDTSKLTKQVDIDAFGTHESIENVEVTRDRIILHVKPKEPRFVSMIENLAEKLQGTLDYCRDVASKRSELQIYQQKIEIKYID